MNRRIFNKLFLLAIIIVYGHVTGCNEADFLSKKPNIALAVPATVADYELLLNHEELFNGYSSPALGALSSDDFYVTDAVWRSSATSVERNAFIFAPDIYQGETYYSDWETPYQQIYYTNIVLEGLDAMRSSEHGQARLNTLKGNALFLRAYAFYNLVQTFALPYREQAAQTDLGIPLVTSSDVNKRYARSTVQETYDKILADALEALDLLPAPMASITKANKISAFAFLARVYLAMGKYKEALRYANECLSRYSELEDYNALTPQRNSISATYPKEVLFLTSLVNYSLARSYIIDPALYATYEENDLRKSHFFRENSLDGTLVFRGTYDVQINRFSGLATDEMYLIRAECNARAGNTELALADLNALLEKRYVTGTFIPVEYTDSQLLVSRILLERRKQLLLRGLRWTDLRRLNQEEAFKKTVTHTVEGVSYTLEPDDKKYAMPIPDEEIRLSGIEQNQR